MVARELVFRTMALPILVRSAFSQSLTKYELLGHDGAILHSSVRFIQYLSRNSGTT